METQSGARTPLVDPFGRELEEWLRDAPATRAPYVSDLVVPPVTGPVQRPDLGATAETRPDLGATAEMPASETRATETRATGTRATESPATGTATTGTATTGSLASVDSDLAFRRPRDRGRHASVCAPSFPEPPERLALRLDELAVEVSAQSGRTTIERIVVLEDEVRRRDEDLARLTAWEAGVAHLADPEVEAARAYARTVFADLLADAADEADRRDRAAARRRAAAGGTGTTRSAPMTATLVPSASAPTQPMAPRTTTTTDDGTEPAAAPVLVLPTLAVPSIASPVLASPVSATTRPTPLVQPATGPTVIDRDAFAAVLRTHRAETAGTPVVFPEEKATALHGPDAGDQRASGQPAGDQRASGQPADDQRASGQPADDQHTTTEHRGWWARTVAAVLRLFGRR